MSQFGVDRLKALGYGTDEYPLSYVPHCVDTAVYRPPADRKQLRDELGQGDGFIIGRQQRARYAGWGREPQHGGGRRRIAAL